MSQNRWKIPLLMGFGTVVAVYGLRLSGVLQALELQALDRLLQLRPNEPIDERVIIVGVNEADLQTLGTSTLSDQVMADLIQKVRGQNPRVIGLDFYRNLPQEPGSAALAEVLRSTPNLIGIEKAIANDQFSAVSGHPVLVAAGRVAASDIVVDTDGQVRRGALYPSTVGDQILPGLGFRLALEYLAAEGIQPENDPEILRIQTAEFPRFRANDGGYVRADEGGYQILLNLRNPDRAFRRVSLSDVLAGRIAPRLMSDRLVLIGSTAVADADIFFTAYSSTPGATKARALYGVELHANLASQIINAVLENRPATIRVFSKEIEWLLWLVVMSISVIVHQIYRSAWYKFLLIAGLSGIVLSSSYLALWLGGWWVPLLPTLGVILGTSSLIHSYRTYQFKLLSTRDELTRLSNRRTFNEALQREWQKAGRSRHPLSLILCDVDYFKRYNDTYGHLQGDECLRAVSRALKAVLRRRTDLAARYGGEEFVLLLPNTDSSTSLKIAEAVRQNVRSLQLEHKASEVAAVVSLSLGVTTLIPDPDYLPNVLVEMADAALYAAKAQGRDRVVERSQ